MRLGGNDKRGVQHRLATSRIQQEIDETSEREYELLRDGKIQTTSNDRVDSKVRSTAALALLSNVVVLFQKIPDATIFVVKI